MVLLLLRIPVIRNRLFVIGIPVADVTIFLRFLFGHFVKDSSEVMNI